MTLRAFLLNGLEALATSGATVSPTAPVRKGINEAVITLDLPADLAEKLRQIRNTQGVTWDALVAAVAKGGDSQ